MREGRAVFLARPTDATPTTHTTLTDDERASLLGRQWWSHADLLDCRDKLLPLALLGDILAGQLSQPAML